MPGIFKLNSEGTIVLTPEAKDLCKVLSKLDPKKFLYIVLVFDTMDSPYRSRPIEDRRRIAVNRIWGPDHKVNESEPLMADAIEEMQSIVYDINVESREMLLTKMQLLNNDLISADSSKIKTILDAIQMVEQRIEDLDTKIDREEEKIYLRGGKRLSFIELFIKNRQKYLNKMVSYGIAKE